MSSVYKGLFITFEGLGGSGKSTHCSLLYNYLKESGVDVVLTSEPAPCNQENIWSIPQDIIAFMKKVEFEHPISDLLMINSIRNEHCKKLIIPSLAAGKTVICDRFIDSTMAYQGYGFGIDIDLIKFLNKITSSYNKNDVTNCFDNNDCSYLIPDMTIVLDSDDIIKKAEKRVSHVCKFKNKIKNDKEFLNRIRKGFLELAKDSNRHHVVDTNRDIYLTHEEIKKKFKEQITEN